MKTKIPLTGKKSLSRVLLIVTVALLCSGIISSVRASVPVFTEHQVTTTPSLYETMPRLGNDGVSNLVVFTSKALSPYSFPPHEQGDIYLQRLGDNGPEGAVVQITSSPTDDMPGDVGGDYVVYTAYTSTESLSGEIILYQISTGATYEIGSAAVVHEPPRIHGNKVVWIEGATLGASQVMLYDISWLGTPLEASVLAGPVPPARGVDIGDRYIVWFEQSGGQYDIVAYDFLANARVQVTTTPNTFEDWPSTSGPWITWRAVDKGGSFSSGRRGFIYDGNTYTTLVVPGASDTYAQGINDLDSTVVGYYYGHGFIYDGTTYTTLDVPGASATYAQGINNAKTVVGYYYDGDNHHGFMKYGPSYTTFDMPGASDTHILGINDAGYVVGYYYSSGVGYHGFMYDGTIKTLDVPGASSTSAYGINDDGIIVGSYRDGSSPYLDHGFIYDGTTYTTLDVPRAFSTYAYGINKAGTVVGYYEDVRHQTQGFMYDGATYTTLDVPGLGAFETHAYGINDAGSVVGYYYYQSIGESRIEAINRDTQETFVIDNGAYNWYPSIDGDLVTWTSTVNDNWDIFVYRISTGETFQVTANPADQFLNNVFGNLVAYVDTRDPLEDVYVSKLVFMPPNQAPIAEAGLAQSVHAGSVVTFDGSGSTDPDGDYPLTYAWEFVSRPAGSAATLSDPSSVNPSFTTDMPGDYTISLVVTDAKVLSSTPDQVLVSAVNTPPVSEAGPDQSVVVLGTVVHLDGTQSYDPDGDPITYLWTITSKPSGSSAEPSDPTSATPTFVADVQGEYVVTLVVTDPFGASSTDSVIVSFSNVKPVADAGLNQAVPVGTTVTLDASGSHDANGDPLTYLWSIISKPGGSMAELSAPSSVQTTFMADKAGSYVISLVVNDGIVDSDPSTVTVTATATPSEVIHEAEAAIDAINGLDPATFKNTNMRNALTNKITAVIQMIEQGQYAEALDKLQNDILQKTDGCSLTGAPDKNDWVKDCTAQGEVYPIITEMIELLKELP